MPPSEIAKYLESPETTPLFITGDTCSVLKSMPTASVDFCMTSPPYWGQREYQSGGIGEEKTPLQYRQSLLPIFAELYRVIKPTGSFWLNVGDTYQGKGLLALPWRLAIAMIDEQGWVLRNDVIWDKIKGGLDQSSDKLRNVHEHIFHFVKSPKGFFFDADAVKTDPRKSKSINGVVVSATGVSGKRYKRQIELSTALNHQEKEAAFTALAAVLNDLQEGKLHDFRMVIRDQHRTTHSDSARVSGRAKELLHRGFYFLKYDPKGTKPTDVWAILPEGVSKKSDHYAPYPEELCIIPLLATCPPDGIALDIFCGTGTTNVVAQRIGRKSIGIDLSPTYIASAHQRAATLL